MPERQQRTEDMGQQTESHTVSPELAKIRSGLEKLLEAYRYAKGLDRDVWDFAVEIHSLCDVGLTYNDLRWLICKDYLTHRIELRRPDERRFRDAGKLKFHKRSCFVLTPAGADFADEQITLSAGDERPTGSSGHSQDGDGHPNGPVPKWDAARRELRVGDKLVKRFKQPSPNQETILAAFQEEGWPPLILDPLPPKGDLDPKERLHNTIKALNRNQKQRLLKMKGDGNGKGITWELMGDGKS